MYSRYFKEKKKKNILYFTLKDMARLEPIEANPTEIPQPTTTSSLHKKHCCDVISLIGSESDWPLPALMEPDLNTKRRRDKPI